MKPFNGSEESGDFWYETLDSHQWKHFNKKLCQSMFLYWYMKTWAPYIKWEDKLLFGLSGSYGNNILCTGKKIIGHFSWKPSQLFILRKKSRLSCTVTDFRISQKEDYTLSLQQNDYLTKLRMLLEDACFWYLASARMKVVWVSQRRFDCFLEVSNWLKLPKRFFRRINKWLFGELTNWPDMQKKRESICAIQVGCLNFESIWIFGLHACRKSWFQVTVETHGLFWCLKWSCDSISF